MKAKALLFDFDGTLVDSMPFYAKIMTDILDKRGIPYGDDLIKIITPLGFLGTAKYYTETLGVKATEEELAHEMKGVAVHEYANNIPAKDNVLSVLRVLKENGYDLNVLTASSHASLDPCLTRLGVFDLFSNVWSCDDFATTKADPAIYRMAAERMGYAVEDVVFFDDNYNADATAKAAGMQVVGVFDPSSEEDTDNIRAVTDHYIRDFSEILPLFGLEA